MSSVQQNINKIFIILFITCTNNILSLFWGPYYQLRENSADILLISPDANINASQLHLSSKQLNQEIAASFEAPLGTEKIIKFTKLPLATLSKSNSKVPGSGYNIYSIVNTKKTPVFNDVKFNLPGKNDPFNFWAYGDLRESESGKNMPGKSYLQKNSIFVGTVEYMLNYLKNNPNKRPLMHVLTGDLVRAGGNVKAWEEFFQTINPVIRNSIFTSSVGNHDVYASAKHIIGFTLWLNSPSVPYFGNLFYFDKPIAGNIKYQDYINTTQRWFDLGCIRFVHLPFLTEEPGKFRPEIFAPPYYATPQHVDEFIKNLETAYKAKQAGVVKFIIVYSHVPMVTAPSHKLPHAGLFELQGKDAAKLLKEAGNVTEETKEAVSADSRDNELEEEAIVGETITIKSKEAETKMLEISAASKRISDAFIKYGVDCHIGGHNHLYDRNDWGDITMITIGTGTQMKKLKPAVAGPVKGQFRQSKAVAGRLVTGRKLIEANTYKQKKLLAFLNFDVDPTNNVIRAQLIGTPMSKSTEYNVLDRFEIRPRLK